MRPDDSSELHGNADQKFEIPNDQSLYIMTHIVWSQGSTVLASTWHEAATDF